MIGRFLELSLATEDIVASIHFYERLGFEQHETGDAWPHRYAVVGDGRLCIGLHHAGATPFPAQSPALCFVRPNLATTRLGEAAAPDMRLGDDGLHYVQTHDPCGQSVLVVEARTFSPLPAAEIPGRPRRQRCGWFVHYSIPAADPATDIQYWEQAGFVALGEELLPFAHTPLTGDGITLALHSPGVCPEPLLLFECNADIVEAGRRGDLGTLAPLLPRGTIGEGATLRSPEGLLMRLSSAE